MYRNSGWTIKDYYANWKKMPISNSKGNPFSGGAKYTGWENFAIFD